MKQLLLILLLILPLLSQQSEEFRHYWYDQGAEITRYELQQARYGEIHPGEAILVYVTERWNPVTQIKAESAETMANSEEILKLNALRRFPTGLYDYSTMNSTFSPLRPESSVPLAYKSVLSVQEWCGQIYSVASHNSGEWTIHGHSYFESEGNYDFTFDEVPLEDGIWTQIRLNPLGLPVGEFQMIPSQLFLRLKHIPYDTYDAVAVLEMGERWNQYRLEFPELERTVVIQFESEFPYTIESWSEEYFSGWGDDRELLTTTAQRTDRIFSPYWEKHDLADMSLRGSLGLD